MSTAPEADLAERDYFSDHSVLLEPYEYFEALRANGPVYRLKNRNLVIITGFEEGVEVLLDADRFSSSIAAVGPVAPLPFVPEGDDISDQIEAAHDPNSPTALMVNYDGDRHVAARSLLTSLFTPSRLRANENFMESYAQRIVGEVVAQGGCELIKDIAAPYVTLVIADLLGVPDEDQEEFRKVIDAGPPSGNIDDSETTQASPTLLFMGAYFTRYIQERRENPRDDVLTELAMSKYPDGSLAPLLEVVKSAMFLFAAGQDTSAKLLGNAIRFLAENPELQANLRDDLSQVPAFIEEMMRLEGSVKATFRLTKKTTTLGGVDLPAGQPVVIAISAGNRDARRWESPAEFQIGRPKIKEHTGFGRGAHTCLGAPLARAEVRVLLEQFLKQTSRISLNEAQHGPVGDRQLSYEPSYIIRGLNDLYVDLAKA
ncbi:MAG: cytochrome P450 [Novosphingobium sp.]|nr:cytochrome P450 [Novosphingobium sp.]